MVDIVGSQGVVVAAAAAAANLLLIDFDDVAVLHLELLGRLGVVDAPAVEQEAQRGDRHTLPVAVRLLELGHARGQLDFEVHLAVVLAHHLELDVLGGALVGSLWFRLLLGHSLLLAS